MLSQHLLNFVMIVTKWLKIMHKKRKNAFAFLCIILVGATSLAT